MSALEAVLGIKLSAERSTAIAMARASEAHQDVLLRLVELTALRQKPLPPAPSAGHSASYALARSVLDAQVLTLEALECTLAAEVEGARQALALAMAERKSIELVLARREQERLLIAKRADQNSTDDIALSRYIRTDSAK